MDIVYDKLKYIRGSNRGKIVAIKDDMRVLIDLVDLYSVKSINPVKPVSEPELER